MSAKKPVAPVKNACVMRMKIDVMVAAPTDEMCEEAIRFRGEVVMRAWEMITIRDESGWINPAYRVEDDGKRLTVEPRRKRKSA